MQDTITRCLGLVTQYNPLSVGKGALGRANNAVIQRENVVEPRRGYKVFDAVASSPTTLMTYNDLILAQYGTSIAYQSGSALIAYPGSYSPPTGATMRYQEAQDNLYVTTDSGVKVFTDTAAVAARMAGAPRCLGPNYTLTGSSGFLQNGYQCAYRALIVRTDANDNVLVGYPSQRLWVPNSSGGSRNVQITIPLPDDAIVGDILKLYRTDQVSGTSTDTAGDEEGLVYQYELISSDILAHSVTIDDIVVDDLRGETIYTAPSQQGIALANDRPPVCKDIALFRDNFLVYANVSTRQRLYVSLVGTLGLGTKLSGNSTNLNDTLTAFADTSDVVVGMKVTGSGIPANTTVLSKTSTTVKLSNQATATATGVPFTFVTARTITLAGTTYSFSDTASPTTGAVGVSVTGVAAADIDITSRSLVNAINLFTTNTSVYAYYLSGPEDLPGQILIEEASVGGAAFTIQVSSPEIADMFFPPPPTSPATAEKSTSSNSTLPNNLAISKDGELEAVPIASLYPVGPKNKAILRIAPLQRSLIIIKEEGVYRLTGNSTANFEITPLDLTVFCKSADSVVTLQNQVFMLSNQGVVAISENGVEVVSRDIEATIKRILAFGNISSLVKSGAYESDRHYFLSLPSTDGDTAPNQTFVYNVFTKTWTRWTFGITDAVVNESIDTLYLVKPGDDAVYSERKDYADSDYADPEIAITITSVSGSTVDFTIAEDTPLKGWVIKQGTTYIAISSITPIAGGWRATMQFDAPADWTTGAADLFPSVGFDVQWLNWTAQAPGTTKQVSVAAIFTDSLPGQNTATALTATFTSNYDEAEEEVDLTTEGSAWGTGAWGEFPWGGAGDPYGYACLVPRNKQYCTRLNVGVKQYNAYERLAVGGFGVEFSSVSERIGR